MCGIAGLVSISHEANLEMTRVEAMTRGLSHRGPDDSGLEALSENSPAVVFGHRRLSIIDTTAAGRQPMCDSVSGNSITFNGEIYNYRLLRDELKRLGHEFRTATDTEVILKAYLEWGHGCVSHLRGIFAFAIWDAKTRTVFVARDQLGVKPLYYWFDGDNLLFASEVRALLSSDLVPRRLCLTGLRSYLSYGSVQDPLTLIEDVRSLLPGHTLEWRDGQVARTKYWSLPAPEAVRDRVPKDVEAQIKERLLRAVDLQMISDVPLGSFLSGGIDSTAIAALMRTTHEQVKTFAVVFGEADYDERAYSRLAAERIGTDHTELSLTGEMVRDELPRALAAFDQPSVDGLNTYFVSKVTRETGLKVALSGVAGDEMFGGYNNYFRTLQVMRWGERFNTLPSAARFGLRKLIQLMPEREEFRKATDLLANGVHPYFISRRLFSSSQVRELLKPAIYEASRNWYPETFSQLAMSTAGLDSVNKASALELQTYLLSTILRDTDQMSMAHALEVRVPFLDHELVEYMFTLPGSAKVSSETPKPLLTKSLGEMIPRECVFRPKRGFELPFRHWLKEALMGPLEQRLLREESEIFAGSTLRSLWSQFHAGQVRWSRMWAIFVFTEWMERNQVKVI